MKVDNIRTNLNIPIGVIYHCLSTVTFYLLDNILFVSATVLKTRNLRVL